MSVTPVGYLFFGSVIFGIGLMNAVSRRKTREGKPLGIGANIYFGLILVIISILFIMGSAFIAKTAFDVVSLPKYDAVIIDFESRWEEVEREDSNGDSYTENVLMHTPTLQFRDDTEEIITAEGNVRSGAEPVIGDTVKIAYKDGELLMVKMTVIGIALGSVMMMIFAYILSEVIAFASGRRPKWVSPLGTVTFAIVIFGGMISMMVGLAYGGVYKYFLPGSDVPLWAMLVSLFFSLILALTLGGMFFGLMKEKGQNKTP